MFRDQVGILTDWFKGWNECEQTVALLSLLKRVSRTQARFLHICLEHWLADCTEINILEAEANNAGIASLTLRHLSACCQTLFLSRPVPDETLSVPSYRQPVAPRAKGESRFLAALPPSFAAAPQQ